ncbi:MAG: hypothetical protein Q9162_000456 [Coniocarpon cinnabarinum]
MVNPTNDTMKAVIWEGHPYHVSLREVPRPTIQDSEDVIVKMTTATICGTDLHVYHGVAASQDKPWELGHEGVGIVSEIGSSVSNLSVGDRVVVPDQILVGSQVFGWGFGTINFPGGETEQGLGGLQAEYARIPNADVNALKLPKDDGDARSGDENDFIMLSDIFCTAWASLTNSGFQAGEAVAIFGAGPVGLLVAYSAFLRGATAVYVIDHVPSRLAKAESIGAVAIDFTKDNPVDQVKKLTGGSGIMRVFDVIGYECVNEKLEPDESYVINRAIDLVAVAGTVFVTGVYYSGKPNKLAPYQSEKRGECLVKNPFIILLTLITIQGFVNFPMAELWAKSATLASGNIVPAPYQSTLLKLIESGRAKPGFVVDKAVNFDEAPEAYRMFSNHEAEKIVLKF